MNVELNSLTLITSDETIVVASKDAPLVSTKKVSDYTNQNSLTYLVICNTWLHITKMYAGECWISLKEAMLNAGLISVIRRAQDSADSVVNQELIADPLFRTIVSAVRLRLPEISDSSDKNVTRDPLVAALQLLRYPKRFSPLGNDIVAEQSLLNFIQVENETKMAQRRERPYWLTTMLRDSISSLLDWDRLCDELDAVTLDDIRFGTGTCYDASSKLGDKLRVVANSFPEYFLEPFGIPYIGCRPTIQPSPLPSVKVLAVPKSYKASRIIAMESVMRQGYALAYGEIIARHLPEFVNIHDQGRNQEMAWSGSRTGELCTLDASNASDRISYTLVRDIFPARFIDRILPCRAPYMEVGNRPKRTTQMFLTSGNGLTFVIETMVYWAIADVCCTLVGRYYTLPSYSYKGTVFTCSAYGDDVILPSVCAETAYDIYHMCGLKINPDKSFSTGDYRESCGEEYLRGTVVSSIYYPRFPVPGRVQGSKVRLTDQLFNDSYRGKIDNSLTMLIDLQHRLFTFCPSAAQFVRQIVRAAHPKMTSSLLMEEVADLWGYDTLVQPVRHEGRFAAGTDRSVLEAARNWDRATGMGLHVTPVLKYRGSAPSDPDGTLQRIVDSYNYQTFLRHGPRYASALDELLGVSERPMTLDQAFGKAKLVLEYTYR